MAFEPLRNLSAVIKDELRTAAKEIKRLSQEEVPVKTGTLRDACEVVEGYDHGWYIKVRYRPDRWNKVSRTHTGKYMLKIHEYPPSLLSHPNGGKWHFLSDPYNAVIKTLRASIQARVRWTLERRGPWTGFLEGNREDVE